MTKGRTLRDRIATGILDTAAAILATRGEAASMADIAAAAGVGRATLYRYFPSREILLQALADTAVEELCRGIAEAELDAVPVREGIARLTRTFLAAGSKYAVLVRERDKLDKPGEIDRRIVEPLLRLFRRGTSDGILRADLPAEMLLALYAGMLEATLDLSARGGLGVEQASAALLTMFLTGALSDPASSR